LAPILPRLQGAANSTYRITTLAVELFFAATVTTLNGGPHTPYVAFWVFAILLAALRWGFRESIVVAALSALFLMMELKALLLWPQLAAGLGETELKILPFLLRGAFLIVVNLLLAYLVVRERTLRAESCLLGRMLERLRLGSNMELALRNLFAELMRLYGIRRLSLALRAGHSEEIFHMEGHPATADTEVARTLGPFSNLEAATFCCPAHTWYFVKRSGRPGQGDLLALDLSGRRLKDVGPEDWYSCLNDTESPSLLVSTFLFQDALQGRLILLDPDVATGEPMRFLQGLVKQISPALQNIYLLRDIRTQIEDQVRAELSRELHDGILQSLLSAEMQIEVLGRQRPSLSGEFGRRLAALQALMHREALDLRDLIEKSKPLTFSPQELPDILAELAARFRLETGILVRLETSEENPMLPISTCHEIVRIVQEGLSNVRKHSGARCVTVTLREDDGQLRLVIADDGQGFVFRGRLSQTQLDVSHRGPRVIKERVRLIGGQLTIDSSPGNWARLEIVIPSVLNG
jgi:signal transduction histidine kinase